MEAFAHLQPVMSFEEIGAELGVSKQGANSLYQSAMRKLRSRRLQHGRDILAELEQRRSYAITNRAARRRREKGSG